MTQMSYISEYIPSTCVHPESRQASGKKFVIVPSLPHRSSGSTVDSLMLDDDEASSVLSDFRPSVDVIPEDRSRWLELYPLLAVHRWFYYH